jgi:hypothetical protein
LEFRGIGGIIGKADAGSHSVSKRAMLFLAAFGVSTGCDFYWGYHSAHSVDDGIMQVLRGFLVLAVLFGFYMFNKSN